MSINVELDPTTNAPVRIGHWLIHEKIGSGVLGIDYRAVDQRTKSEAIIRVVHAELTTDTSTRTKMVREAKAFAEIRDHDHVAAIYSVDQISLDNDRFLLAITMPLLKGETLEQRIARSLPLSEQLRITRQLAEGLSAIHRKWLVHRDIRAANVRLESGDTAVIVASEQLLNDQLTVQDDLRGLGTIMSHMAKGSSLSPAHRQLIDRLLANDPPTAGDVLKELDAIEHPQTSAPTPVAPSGRGASKLWLVGLVSILLVGVGFWLLKGRASLETKPEVVVAPTKSEPIQPPLLKCPADEAEVKRIQKLWADHLKLPVVFEEELATNLKLKWVLIPPGTFEMGTSLKVAGPAARVSDDERPEREVTISKPFYLGMYEISRIEFGKFVEMASFRTQAEVEGTGSWGWDSKSKLFQMDETYSWKVAGFPSDETHPVMNISWNDAQAFCAWLSRREGGSRNNRKVILPREAEWEFACRSGTTTAYSFGDQGDAKQVNASDAQAKKVFPERMTGRGDDGFPFTAPPGKFKANPFGLFDMHGNVGEWCYDWYGPYDNLPMIDPVQDKQQSEESRIVRGGAWTVTPLYARSASRNGNAPDYRNNNIGFRVCFRIE